MSALVSKHGDLDQTVEHVAGVVARLWRSKNLRHPYEDLYNEAVCVMHKALPGYDEDKGTLDGFLYSVCYRRLFDYVTRACSPVGTRSKTEIVNLKNLVGVEFRDHHGGADTTNLEHAVMLTQARERMLALSEQMPEGKLALTIVLGYTSVDEQAGGDRDRRNRLYYCVKRMRKALREDQQLADLAEAI